MNHLISPKDVIKAYQVIRDNGTKEVNGYRYKALLAQSDGDGYTVFVSDSFVSMTVYYHYKYHLEYTNKKQLEGFKLKLNDVLRGSE